MAMKLEYCVDNSWIDFLLEYKKFLKKGDLYGTVKLI